MDVEAQSLNSSVEVHDAIINESWDWGNLHGDSGSHWRNGRPLNMNIGSANESVFGKIWRYWSEKAINRRLAEFEKDENMLFKVQLSAKIKQISADEETKKLLIKRMLCGKNQELHDSYEVLRRKYGYRMAECLQQSKSTELSLSSYKRRISGSIMETIFDAEQDEAKELRKTDPLINWFRQKSDVSGRMLARIQNFAHSTSSKVKWSFLIEPGHPQTDLSNFFAEYDILRTFFDKVELSPTETSQKAFDANCLAKARNRKIECVDCSRVKLAVPSELTEDVTENHTFNQSRPQPSDIFGDFDCPHVNVHNKCGYGDFIHANYVVGGPLLNKFILSQAPLPNTIPDFWRMIWQEKSKYIFMLCDASDCESLGLMSTSIPDCCPYYWPRYEGETKQFGRLFVRNNGIDATVDPLFNVTYLTLWVEDDPGNRLKVQHWQWDWRTFTDCHWPFRLLLRSRHSKTPTVVQCLDGCGRSGTLVLIEIILMQLLRGTTSYENTMLTSANFLRLQRRHAVANSMQYLFVYRTVIHWAQPFVISAYHRFVLGLMFRNSGFVGKYEQIARFYYRKSCSW